MINGENILLVLDDEPMIARLITRFFKHDFSEILYASTPNEAETMLQKNVVTHFICDSNLGSSNLAGIEYIEKWCAKYSNIKKAILFTGLDTASVPTRSGVRVISKNYSPNELLGQLRDSFLPSNCFSEDN